jgi:LuxR family transcriptional activator of bioluminescence operon
MDFFKMDAVYEINDNLRLSENDNDLNSCLTKLALLLDCEYYLFAILNPVSIFKSDLYILDNYPSCWKKYYNDEKLIDYDPIIDYSASNYAPIIWSMLEQSKWDKNKTNVIEEAKNSNLKSGFSFPVHTKNNSFGVISFANSNNEKTLISLHSNSYSYVLLVLPELLDSHQRINKNIGNTCTHLTPREKECLAWISEGKTTWEISKILGCSERTVSFHITNLQTKLGTNNRSQSISKSILTGVMNPFPL